MVTWGRWKHATSSPYLFKQEVPHTEPLSSDGVLVLAGAGSRGRWAPTHVKTRHLMRPLGARREASCRWRCREHSAGAGRACSHRLCSRDARDRWCTSKDSSQYAPAPAPAAACLGAEAEVEAAALELRAGWGAGWKALTPAFCVERPSAAGISCSRGRSYLEDL